MTVSSGRLQTLRDIFAAGRGILPLAVIGGVAFALTVAVFAPGYMSHDSGNQLQQARSLDLVDTHPVLMAFIWRLTDRILPGPLGMFVLMTGLYWAGMTALFWILDAGVLVRAAALLAVGLFPPVFSVVPVLWKDQLMQASLVAAVACLIAPTRRARPQRIVLGFVLIVVAIGARHNAALAAWPFAALALHDLPMLAHRPWWVRLALSTAAGIAITLILTLTLNRALAPLARKDHAWQRMATWDLAAMSLRKGEVLVDSDTGVLTPGMGLAEMRQVFQPDYALRMYHCIPFAGRGCVVVFSSLTDPQKLARLQRNWRRAVLQHPGAYLAHRLEHSSRLLGLANAPASSYYLARAPHHPLARAYPVPPRAVRALAWLDASLQWTIFRPWVYVLLLVLLLPVALVRLVRAGRVLPVLFVVSGLAYCLGVVVLAGSPEYRYMVWTILCALLAVVTTLVPTRAPPAV